MRLPAIDQDTDRRVRKAVVERLAEESNEALDYYVNNMPGLKDRSGRERLAFYRTRPIEWWLAVFAEFPRGDYSALALFRDWRELSRIYGRIGDVG